MRAAAALQARAERAYARLAARGAVLMYHRIVDETHDPWSICVGPDQFDQHMLLLRKRAEPGDLAAVAADRGLTRAGRPRAAVTFDDGYRDNILTALPILERHEIPATIFVVSGAVGSPREFWWDELERYILHAATLPEALELETRGQPRRWILTVAAQAGAAPGWDAETGAKPGSREHLFLQLWEILVHLADEDRDDALARLRIWSGVSEAPAPGRLPIGPDDLARLAAHPLIEIGAHTEGHLSLPQLAPAERRRQVEAGQNTLESVIGRPVRRFSFPFGRRDPVSDAVVRARFDLACTSRPAALTPFSNPFSLPRIQVIAGDGDAFDRRVRNWLPQFAPG